MDTEREEIHALSTETHTQNMGQDNNSPTENVHNMVSGILRQWTLVHVHNTVGQDNNSPPENVHNTVSGILRQWIERERRNTWTFNRNTHSKHGTRQQLTD